MVAPKKREMFPSMSHLNVVVRTVTIAASVGRGSNGQRVGAGENSMGSALDTRTTLLGSGEGLRVGIAQGERPGAPSRAELVTSAMLNIRC